MDGILFKDRESAGRALAAKAAMLAELGIQVSLCGRVDIAEG